MDTICGDPVPCELHPTVPSSSCDVQTVGDGKTSRKRTSSYFRRNPARQRKTGSASQSHARTTKLERKRRRPQRLQKTSPYFKAALHQADRVKDDKQGVHVDEKQGEPVDEEQGEPVDEKQGKPVDEEQGEPVDEKQGEPVDEEQGELVIQVRVDEGSRPKHAGEEDKLTCEDTLDQVAVCTALVTCTIPSGSTGSTCVRRHRHLLYPHFKPPQSPFGLVQEQLYNEPWKLLVATIFLNRTTGLAAKPILWEFFRLYPNPAAAIQANLKELALLFQPLGLHRKRAKGVVRFSDDYLNRDWVYPIECHGIGKYGNDSYRIFCTYEWKEVRPTDQWLNKYYAWLCQLHQYQPTDWTP